MAENCIFCELPAPGGANHYQSTECLAAVKAMNATLKVENARFRTALADIAHGPTGTWNQARNLEASVSELMDTAARALKDQ